MLHNSCHHVKVSFTVHLVLFVFLIGIPDEQRAVGYDTVWCCSRKPTFQRTLLATPHFNEKVDDSKVLQNSGILLQHYTALQPRQPQLESSMPWEPQISHIKTSSLQGEGKESHHQVLNEDEFINLVLDLNILLRIPQMPCNETI